MFSLPKNCVSLSYPCSCLSSQRFSLKLMKCTVVSRPIQTFYSSVDFRFSCMSFLCLIRLKLYDCFLNAKYTIFYSDVILIIYLDFSFVLIVRLFIFFLLFAIICQISMIFLVTSIKFNISLVYSILLFFFLENIQVIQVFTKVQNHTNTLYSFYSEKNALFFHIKLLK